MKNLIYGIAITCSFYCTEMQNTSELKDESVIINKVIDMVSEKDVRPKSVFIGEQVLSDLDQYLIGRVGEKSDTLSLLIDGKWNYLKQMRAHPYSKDWRKISLSKSVDGKKIIAKNKKDEDIEFSPIQFSPDSNRVFVVYNRLFKNISQATVFFFFEKKNGTWVHKVHYIPFFD